MDARCDTQAISDDNLELGSSPAEGHQKDVCTAIKEEPADDCTSQQDGTGHLIPPIPLSGVFATDNFNGRRIIEAAMKCEACGQHFQDASSCMLHQCNMECDFPDFGAPNSDLPIFECSKCCLLFNEVRKLEKHKCLGLMNEPERLERKRRRMVTVHGMGPISSKQKSNSESPPVQAVFSDKKAIKLKINLKRIRESTKKSKIEKDIKDKNGRNGKTFSKSKRMKKIVEEAKEDSAGVSAHFKEMNHKTLSHGIAPTVNSSNRALEENCTVSVDESSPLSQHSVKDGISNIVGQKSCRDTDVLGSQMDDELHLSAKDVPRVGEDGGGNMNCMDENENSRINKSNFDRETDSRNGLVILGGLQPEYKQSSVGLAGENQRSTEDNQTKKTQLKKAVKPRRVRQKTDPANLICKLCNKKCRKQYELMVHMRGHENNKPFKCSKCGKSYVTNSHLNKHIRDVHEATHLQCKECKIRFSTKELLKAHCEQFGHSILWPFPCPECDRSYPNKKSLQIHQVSHKGYKPFSCSVCPAAFNTQVSLTQHMRTHSGDRPYKCSMCGNSFLTRHLLNAHMMSHTGERPHLCDICGKGFKLAAQLRTHMEIHEDDKQYVCDVCGKKFKWRYNMLHHAKVHDEPTDQRTPRFFCNVCGKRYLHKSGLEYHMRTHTGERPYQCPKCGKRFRHKAHLTKHLKTVHATCGKSKTNPAPEPKKPRKITSKVVPKLVRCSLCSQVLNSKAALVEHVEAMHPPPLVAADPPASQPVMIPPNQVVYPSSNQPAVPEPTPILPPSNQMYMSHDLSMRGEAFGASTLDTSAIGLDPFHLATMSSASSVMRPTQPQYVMDMNPHHPMGVPSSQSGSLLYQLENLHAMPLPHNMTNPAHSLPHCPPGAVNYEAPS